MRRFSGTGLGRVGLFTFGIIALLAIGALALVWLLRIAYVGVGRRGVR